QDEPGRPPPGLFCMECPRRGPLGARSDHYGALMMVSSAEQLEGRVLDGGWRVIQRLPATERLLERAHGQAGIDSARECPTHHAYRAQPRRCHSLVAIAEETGEREICRFC